MIIMLNERQFGTATLVLNEHFKMEHPGYNTSQSVIKLL